MRGLSASCLFPTLLRLCISLAVEASWSVESLRLYNGLIRIIFKDTRNADTKR